MKKVHTIIFITITALTNYSFAQSKPELPPDFFDAFNYNLSMEFDYNDSAKLVTEIKRLATEMNKWNKDALTNYVISDSTSLYFFLDRYSAENAFLGNYDKAIAAILQMRQLRPSPIYQLPLRLPLFAYSKASLISADDGSKQFQNIYSQRIREEYNKIDERFKNDVVNQSKATWTKQSKENYWKTLKRFLDQSINKSAGKVNWTTAFSILTAYQAYYQRMKYQELVEKVLYEISPSKVQEQQTKIAMRDGVKLNAYIYTDVANESKLPAIISVSPYPSGNEAIKGNVFATNGCIYVYVDTRGRRESEGNFTPYENDARDYYDIIEWASKQSWCNGQVATTGGSYLGFNQWQAIRKEYKHPALKAINPIVSVGFGVDFPRQNNMFYPYMLRWATYVSGKELNQALFNDGQFWEDKYYDLYKKRLPFSKLDSVASMPNAIFQKWLNHPDFDGYWKNILPNKVDYQTLDIPVLSITGYYDADHNGAMYYYNQHQLYGTEKSKTNHNLLVGPFDHAGAQWQPGPIQSGIDIEKEAQIPIYKYVIWWYDWVLKGKNKPEFIKDKITYFETGNNQWKGTSSLKSLTTDSLELFLSASLVPNTRRHDLRALTLRKPLSKSSVLYKHDISAALDSSFLFAQTQPFSDSLDMVSPYNVIFESPLLTKDIVISDKITTRLYAMLNVPDADFEISIEEISPDGKVRRLAYDKIRVRYRNGGETPQLAKPGSVIQLNFSSAYVYIKRVNKGSKLRLVFQSVNNPWSEKNYGFGGIVSKESTINPRIIETTILTSTKYPSKIVIPYTNK